MSIDQSNDRIGERSLSDLVAELGSCDPAKRIALREPILAFGPACIGPLGDLAVKNPDLSASVASWLGVLAGRQPETKGRIVSALKRLPAGSNPGVVQEVLARLGHVAAANAMTRTSSERAAVPKAAAAPKTAATPRTAAAPKTPARTSAAPKTPAPKTAESRVHARLIKAAREGKLLTYADLEANRGNLGKYLENISRSEVELGRPPLISLVVSETNGKPGGGFLPTMVEIGYAHRGEKLEVVWPRAVAEVKAYWVGRDEKADK